MKGTIGIGAATVAVVAALSVVGASQGWTFGNDSADVVQSLLVPDSIRVFLTEAPSIAIGYPPFGTILLCSLGAGVMAASGLLHAIADFVARKVPGVLITPAVFLMGLICHQVSDALYVVYLPLCGMIFQTRGRNPVLGVMLGFAAFSGALYASLFPGLQDIVLLGITEQAARAAGIAGTISPMANMWFSSANAVALTLVAWALVDRVVPRFAGASDEATAAPATTRAFGDGGLPDSRGLLAAGAASLLVLAGFALLALVPDVSPLRTDTAAGMARFEPLYKSGAAIITLTSAAAGTAYGFASGRWRKLHRVAQAVEASMRDLTPFLLMAIFIAFVVKAIDVSNLGRLAAHHLAELVRASDWHESAIAALLMAVTALADFLMFSASAKWTVIAPTVLPALDQSGVSPAVATAAFRVGDAVVNVVNPLQPAAVYALISATAWDRSLSMARLMGRMAAFAASFFVVGLTMLMIWSALGLPFGPG
ncbi:AbgT family transporter [Brevundimonas subvibrioides]|uniref:AbgT putative transporter n=1 Tax=Brevundimonas subvibrioides (strain ATCC 15264 / DSM 4735 / LMG 14903 / NBRC 16000 / CB 81) TaxID=633149 RepID=D9QJW1_BRESC|nr:AbgT family transporter [Brevundimonas subvibrioides]ADK99712.1 AbgT putative transporter [Brevundimonas subvibrioides ATCC 15264]